MDYKIISKESKKFKGNLHSHTTHSDGFLGPAESKAYYKDNGYHFIAFTDHEIYSDFREELNDENFIIIPGIEASTKLVYSQGRFSGKTIKTHHVLALLGTSEMQKKATSSPLKHLERLTPTEKFDTWDGLSEAQNLVNSLHEKGLAITYNHPLWSRVEFEEFANLENVCSFEVFNYGTEIECGLGDATLYWDKLLTKGIKMHAFACDDNHNTPKLPDSFGGAIMVCAEKLSHDDIMENFIKGNFYSTSGVEIEEWGIRGNEVYIHCSDVNRINFIVSGKLGDGATAFCQNIDDTINHAVYTLKGSEHSIRIECIDKYGRKAWTNPFYFS